MVCVCVTKATTDTSCLIGFSMKAFASNQAPAVLRRAHLPPLATWHIVFLLAKNTYS